MLSKVVFYIVLSLLLVQCAERLPSKRIVRISQGPVCGYRDPHFDLFAFYGIPYATAPTGRDKFKAPLPPPSWLSTFEAVNKDIICPQILLPKIVSSNKMIQENCLVANVFVPDTKETGLPVLVQFHGGAFQFAHGMFFTLKRLMKIRPMILVSFNFRLGIHGFLCLGTNYAPGNAGMKDQVALLRWVKKNIARFGGNPNDVTIQGYSAGGSSVDLLMLSPAAKGLFNKIIPESGVSLCAYSVQNDPIKIATEYARKFNVTNIGDISALEDFYTNAPLKDLFTDNYLYEKDNTFNFSPCVEKKTNEEAFLDDSPFNILNSGNYEKLPILYGFNNMEGTLRLDLFSQWKSSMNKQFSYFMPNNLRFENDDVKRNVTNQVKAFYFSDKVVSGDNILDFIDYVSDTMFIYPTLWVADLQLKAGNDRVYLYEFQYVDEKDPKSEIPHTKARGATHCAQTLALADGDNSLYKEARDEEIRTVMRQIWANFITTGSPVPPGSELPAWPPTGAGGSPYMAIGKTMRLQAGPPIAERARFWRDIYAKHYQAPIPPSPVNRTIRL